MASGRQLAVVATILAAATAQIRGQDATHPPQITPRSRIAELITQLDDPSFHVRQQATSKLTQSGPEVIPALTKATEHESLEVGVRALHILTKLYLNGENETVDRAESALEQLAQHSKNRSIASRAHTVMKRYYAVIGRKRAIADIEKLGGKIVYRDASISPPSIPNTGKPPIEFVQLGNNWKGGDEGLKYIKRLVSLRRLYLIDGVRISDKSKDDLQQSMPQLQIQFRGRAYLGIAGSPAPNGQGCWVTVVKKGAAADKAQLIPGDIITEFGGKTVPDFDALIKLIREKQPHDKVKVGITRDGVRLTLLVELGEW